MGTPCRRAASSSLEIRLPPDIELVDPGDALALLHTLYPLLRGLLDLLREHGAPDRLIKEVEALLRGLEAMLRRVMEGESISIRTFLGWLQGLLQTLQRLSTDILRVLGVAALRFLSAIVAAIIAFPESIGMAFGATAGTSAAARIQAQMARLVR